MIIVVEGPDNAGKTTLVNWLASVTGMAVQHSGGPGKSPEEISNRCHRLLEMDNVIFDRFPLISDRVYAPILRGVDNFTPESLAEISRRLRQRRSLIIYCRPKRDVLLHGIQDHKTHGHDTQEHIDQMKLHAEEIIDAYDAMMANMAPMPLVYNYKEGGSFQRDLLLSRIQHLQNHSRLDHFEAVGAFHAKFDLPMFDKTPIGFPTPDVVKFRIDFLKEELVEFCIACAEGDLAKAIDALVDMDYVILGTAHMFGVNFPDHFQEVHKANMQKERARGVNDPRSTRAHALNVVKPFGWKPPDHGPIIERTRRAQEDE